MGYTRDRDRVTRGVGAIASLDHALPRRQAQRRQVMDDTRRHDRAMAAVTRGALGAVVMPLGGGATYSSGRDRFDRALRDRAPARDIFHPAAPPPKVVAVPSGTYDHRHGGLLRPLVTALEPVVKALPQAPAPPPPPTPPPTAPAPAPSPPPAPAPSAPPAPGPATSGPATGSGGGGSRSSGGGSGGSGGSTAPLPPLPDVPEAPAEDNTTRNYLMIGGAALAAYLLLFRGRS